MNVKILCDSEADKGLLSGQGFACLVDGKILFDTGEASTSLVENMHHMLVSVDDIEAVVISHDHWDHTSGLWEILRRRRGMKVYACPSFSETFKRCVGELGGNLIVSEGAVEITKNIFVTGEIAGTYNEKYLPEQALVIKGEKGVSVLTGCAHPGIINVLKYAKNRIGVEDLYMVFGGFHLAGMGREAIGEIISGLKKFGVQKAGPTHCSGDKAKRIFCGKYLDNFIDIKAGNEFQV